MQLITYSIISVLIIKFIVFLIYIYLYTVDRKLYFIILASSLGLFSLSSVLEFVVIYNQELISARIFKEIFFLFSCFMDIRGIFYYLDKKLPNWWIAISLLVIGFAISGGFLHLPFLVYYSPLYLSTGILIVLTGITFLRFCPVASFIKYLAGYSYIIWGLHVADYPFIRAITWIAPFGFALTAMLALIIPVSLLLVFFQQAKSDLVKSNERYHRLVNLLPDAIIISCNSNIIFANPAGIKLLGAENLKEIVDKDTLSFVHPDYYNFVNTDIEKLFNNETNLLTAEFKLIRKEGTILDVEAQSILFLDEKETMVLSVLRDITERKQNQELKVRADEKSRLLNEAIELDKLKTDFFANISHELRTPLNLILSSIQVSDLYIKEYLQEDNDKKMKKYLSIIKQNCFRLLRLINNLIDITKIDSGFLEVQLYNCNIVSIVEETALSVSDYIRSKGISIQFDTEVEEKYMACDPEKIERIMLNLLSNAVKFTKPGGNISVNISDRQDCILISVKDTGIGISNEKINLIFDRFRQVDRSLSRSHEGSGIGLSIVKSLVEIHGGSITVLSNYGKGSEFIVELPVRQMDKEPFAGSTIHLKSIEMVDIELSDLCSKT